MAVSVSVTSQSLYPNENSDPPFLTLTFGYTGSSITPSSTTIYYGATLTDTQTPATTEPVLFSYVLPAGTTTIPPTADIEYVPGVTFVGTISAVTDTGKVYYVK